LTGSGDTKLNRIDLDLSMSSGVLALDQMYMGELDNPKGYL